MRPNRRVARGRIGRRSGRRRARASLATTRGDEPGEPLGVRRVAAPPGGRRRSPRAARSPRTDRSRRRVDGTRRGRARRDGRASSARRGGRRRRRRRAPARRDVRSTRVRRRGFGRRRRGGGDGRIHRRARSGGRVAGATMARRGSRRAALGPRTRGPARETRATRAFLAQKMVRTTRRRGKLEGARLDLLRSLPIFETQGNRKVCGVRNGRENAAEHSDSGTRADHHSDSASEEDSTRFVALDASPAPMLAPSDADPSLLSSAFLRVGGDAEANLLETRCGVTRASLATVLADFALPALAAGELPSSAAPRARWTRRSRRSPPRAPSGPARRTSKNSRRRFDVTRACPRRAARSRVRPTCSILASNVSERFWILANVSRRRPSTPAIASRRSPSWACARVSRRGGSLSVRAIGGEFGGGKRGRRGRGGARRALLDHLNRLAAGGMTRYPRRITRRMRSRETRIATTALLQTRPSRCGASWDPSRGVPC